MLAQKTNTANSRVPYHSRLQAATVRFLATALREDLRRGNIEEMKAHMRSAVETVEQQRGLDMRARAEIYLALGESARALGDLDTSEYYARRVVTMPSGNLLDIIAAAERLQALLLLDKGDIEAARKLADSIDKLHVIRPHADTLLAGEDGSVSLATLLVIAEIELADRKILAARAAVERALLRVGQERSDAPGFADSCNALLLMKHLVFGCAGDDKSGMRLDEIQHEWRRDAAVSTQLRARLALLSDSVAYGLTHYDGQDISIVLNAQEATRWNRFREFFTPPQISEITPDKTEGGAYDPVPRAGTALDENNFGDTGEDLSFNLDLFIEEVFTQAERSSDQIKSDISSAQLLPTEGLFPNSAPPVRATASNHLIGDLLIRLDVMNFDVIIQGLERATNTGRLDLQFDDATLVQAVKEGAIFAEIPDPANVVGGTIFIDHGLLIDACLTYSEGQEMNVEPIAALALLAQISIGYAASVQASFTRNTDEHPDRFTAGNNIALLLSILASNDEKAVSGSGPDTLSLDKDDHLPVELCSTDSKFLGDNGASIDPRDVLSILNATSPEELCSAFARVLRASHVELRYKSDIVISYGIDNQDDTQIDTHYGDYSLHFRLIPEGEPRAFKDREQALAEMTYNRLFAMPRTSRPSDVIYRRDTSLEDSGIVAASKVIFDLFGLVHRLAQFDGTSLPVAHILIIGETGTGKEIVAKMIHECSGRKSLQFIPVNTATITTELAPATIFGAKKGSYTGAATDRRGLIEAADGGTLFLDEIGNTNEALQAMLLRVAQDGTYQRVGDTETRTSNTRLVMATNQNVEDPYRFKPDLKYRCQIIRVPPLRERREDIRPLADAFARSNSVTLNESAYLWLERQDWPGNVRELSHFIQRAAAQVGHGDTINANTLASVTVQGHYAPPLPPLLPSENYRQALARIEMGYLSLVLAEAGSNMNQAAKLFGVSRNTFLSRLAAHNVSYEK